MPEGAAVCRLFTGPIRSTSIVPCMARHLKKTPLLFIILLSRNIHLVVEQHQADSHDGHPNDHVQRRHPVLRVVPVRRRDELAHGDEDHHAAHHPEDEGVGVLAHRVRQHQREWHSVPARRAVPGVLVVDAVDSHQWRVLRLSRHGGGARDGRAGVQARHLVPVVSHGV